MLLLLMLMLSSALPGRRCQGQKISVLEHKVAKQTLDLADMASKLHKLEQAFETKTADSEKKTADLEKKTADLQMEVGQLKVKNLALEQKAARTQTVLVTGLKDTTPAYNTILKFQNVVPGSEGYDSSSGQFVAKHDGTYLVMFSMTTSTIYKSLVSYIDVPGVFLYKDEERYLSSYTKVDNRYDWRQVSLSAAVQMRQGQKLSIRTWISGMNINRPIFSAVLVHST